MEEGIRRKRYCYNEVLPFTVMVSIECLYVGLNTIFKFAAMNKGLSYYVLITYSYSIAVIVLLPSNFLYRKTILPPLSFRILGKLFLMSLLGSSSLMLAYKGINYSNPTLSSALSNLIPAFTFILAIIFRMEILAWRSLSSQAKILGTLVSISGALIVILYKGPAIILFAQKTPSVLHGSLDSSDSNWVLGGLLLASAHIITTLWYILQADIIREYPAELVVIFFHSLFGAMISGIVGLFFETNPSSWILQFDMSFAAVIYSGLLNSVLANCVHVWVVHRKGPVYVTMFKPLSIAIAAAMGVMFLGDILHLGSVIGAIGISLGFYAVMWGKTIEETRLSSEKAPLLWRIKEDCYLESGNS